MNNAAKDSSNRSLLSRGVDTLFTVGLLFIASYLWFVYRTKIPSLSILLSLLTTCLVGLCVVLWKRRQALAGLNLRQRQALTEYLSESLEQQSPEEFKWQLMKLLLKSADTGNIKSRTGYLETTILGKKTAVGYHHGVAGDAISARQLALFIREIRSIGFDNAYYITTGKFMEGCDRLIDRSPSFHIELIDGDSLIRWMASAGITPGEEILNQRMQTRIQPKKRRAFTFRREVLKPKRIRTYLAYALFFWVIATVIPGFTVYYTMLAGLFFTLAVFTFFLNLHPKHRENPADSLPEMIKSSQENSLHG